MAAIKKTDKAVEAVAETKAVEAAAEKKAPAKKTAAKKTAAPKAAAPKAAAKKTTTKAAAKKTAASENVFVEYLGAQISSTDLIAKAKKDSGVKSPKDVNVYVKPEENKVYYVIDGKEGSFFLV